MNKIDLNGYVAISLEDYAEYQELKQPKIDYSRLKTGSVVKIKYSGQHCHGIESIDLERNVCILLYKSECFFSDGELTKTDKGRSYITFIQDDKLCHFASWEKIDYITEVISY